MTTHAFFTALAIAGTAVLWRNWLVQHPKAEAFLQQKLRGYSPVLTCGSCFTYWLALIAVLAHDPLSASAFGVSTSTVVSHLALLALSWMAMAYLSVMLRFSYILIQEQVSILVHDHGRAHGTNIDIS